MIVHHNLFRSLDAVLAFKHGTVCPMTTESSEPQSVNSNESTNEDQTTKRRLRSHKNTEENEFILDLGAVAHQSGEENTNNISESKSAPTQMTSLSLLRQLLPTNISVSSKTRELLQDILAWQILPSDAPTEPSMVYGAIHLSRMIVKFPDFINATSMMSDDKLKLLLQYLDCFIEYVKMQIFSFSIYTIYYL